MNYKLTHKQKEEICNLYTSGRYNQPQLAELYSIGQPAVNGILRRRNITAGRHRLTKEEQDKICNLYLSGQHNQRYIGKLYGISSEAIWALLSRKGILEKQKRLTKEEIEELCRLYQTHQYSYKYLGRKYGVTGKSISELLRNRNIPIERTANDWNRKYKLDENVFNKIDTEEKAYWLGFLYADGSVSYDRDKIKLTVISYDIEILRKFQSFLKTDLPLQKEKNTKSITAYAYSPQLKSDLIKLGCTPRKTYDLTFPTKKQVPKNLLRHFIRGHLDGDGCISKCHIQTIGTDIFCSELAYILKENLGIETKIRDCNKNGSEKIKRLYINKKAHKSLFLDWIYKDATIYLERKYNKYLELCKYG